MSAGDVHSILYRGEDPLAHGNFEPKYDPNKKVQRYWPGKAPDYALNEPEPDEIYTEDVQEDDRNDRELVLDTKAQDRRLQRIEKAREGPEAARAKQLLDERIRQRKAELEDIENEEIVVEEERPEEEKFVLGGGKQKSEVKAEELDDDAIAVRRERLRQKARPQRQAEERKLEELAVQQHGDMEQEFYESSEYEETDSEDEDPTSRVLLKPVFVPKQKRQTVKEKEAEVLEELARSEEKKKKLAERKHQSHQMLVATIRTEEEDIKIVPVMEAQEKSDNEMPDDIDEGNEAEEYELWKIRELKRIKRDREEREAATRLAEEVERRRGLTEEERRIDDKRIDSMVPVKERKYKYNFMQKYYHKGAFFQDKAISGEEPLYLRDYAAPVGEDNMDKNLLPKAMRLRRGQFGRQGQVKHTHLMEVDTTDFTAPWTVDISLNKHAAVKGKNNFEKPGASKKH